MYRKSDYLAHRKETIERVRKGQKELLKQIDCNYKLVQDKYGISYDKVKELLKCNTFTEILEGCKVKGKVIPKEKFRIGCWVLLFVLLSLLFFCTKGKELQCDTCEVAVVEE